VRCGEDFRSKHKAQSFCSIQCRNRTLAHRKRKARSV
jgi:hypothetical protein